jgi:pilus assembly protein Flp/PilA
MELLRRLWKEEDGQGATEYMLIIGVIVIAVIAAAYVFIEPFQDGVEALGDRIKAALSGGTSARGELD